MSKKQNYAVIGYSKADLDNHFSASGKAFYIDYLNGEWNYHGDSHIWIPKSICTFSETNDVGNVQISIPVWFANKNEYDYRRFECFSHIEYK